MKDETYTIGTGCKDTNFVPYPSKWTQFKLWLKSLIGARHRRKRIRIDANEIRIEQNLIDTYSSVVVIKKHEVVSL